MTHPSDNTILGAIPDHIVLPSFLKATPVEESGKRFLYIEASNEAPDRQGEVMLQKALEDSSDFYLRHGNIDIAHYTLVGASRGMADYMSYEIGRPLDVRVSGGRTFVKSILYRGDSPMGRRATEVWESVTKQHPPARWYPSVGGAVLAKSVKIDPNTGNRVGVISRVRWNNIGLTRTPVNTDVPEVSTAPIGMFAKSLDGFVIKGLEAGYGTDSASLIGGAALRTQSLYGAKDGSTMNYFDLRERLAGAIKDRTTAASYGALKQHLRDQFGLSEGDATECTGRFLRDLLKPKGEK